jgi:5'-deoxynucleotidase YfbR-like HD superfamily hydrolase
MVLSENMDAVCCLLDFLRRTEALKSTLRSAWTQSGRQESTAEHSWRLCLFAMLVSREYPELDALKILHLCIVHDMGETIHGDIPAPEQTGSKDEQERNDMVDLLRPLPEDMQKEIMDLWEEYESAKTPDFDYAFNLNYGTQYTEVDSLVKELRAAVDLEMESCILFRRTHL